MALFSLTTNCKAEGQARQVLATGNACLEGDGEKTWHETLGLWARTKAPGANMLQTLKSWKTPFVVTGRRNGKAHKLGADRMVFSSKARGWQAMAQEPYGASMKDGHESIKSFLSMPSSRHDPGEPIPTLVLSVRACAVLTPGLMMPQG
eukprot:661374-Pelagomonas_calceolata.AAC.2